MRIWVLLLVLLNLAFFAWMTRQGAPQPVQPERPLPGLPPYVEPLVLLGERQASGPEPAEETSPPATTEREAPVPSPETQSSVNIPGPEPEAVGEQQEVTEAGAPPETSGPLCHTLGPFLDDGAADEARTLLEAEGMQVSRRAASIKVPDGFWVYLPTMPADEAEAVVKDLVARGIKDYFRGPQNFISLGIYRDRRMAEERSAEIEALGYSPLVEQRLKDRAVVWLDITEQPPTAWDEARWNRFLEALEGDIHLQSLACN